MWSRRVIASVASEHYNERQAGRRGGRRGATRTPTQGPRLKGAARCRPSFYFGIGPKEVHRILSKPTPEPVLANTRKTIARGILLLSSIPVRQESWLCRNSPNKDGRGSTTWLKATGSVPMP